MKLPKEVTEMFREVGKKGGRPATVQHVTGKYCRCAGCRKDRGEWQVAGEKEKSVKKNEDREFNQEVE